MGCQNTKGKSKLMITFYRIIIRDCAAREYRTEPCDDQLQLEISNTNSNSNLWWINEKKLQNVDGSKDGYQFEYE